MSPHKQSAHIDYGIGIYSASVFSEITPEIVCDLSDLCCVCLSAETWQDTKLVIAFMKSERHLVLRKQKPASRNQTRIVTEQFVK
jgi:hypothetical protein